MRKVVPEEITANYVRGKRKIRVIGVASWSFSRKSKTADKMADKMADKNESTSYLNILKCNCVYEHLYYVCNVNFL